MTSGTNPETTGSTADPVVVVLTTFPVEADVEAFAGALVEERLAACVSIGPAMTSIYTWKGAIERAAERHLLVKTVQSQVPLIKARLATLHPYDVPEVVVLPVTDGLEAYLAWVRESTTA